MQRNRLSCVSSVECRPPNIDHDGNSRTRHRNIWIFVNFWVETLSAFHCMEWLQTLPYGRSSLKWQKLSNRKAQEHRRHVRRPTATMKVPRSSKWTLKFKIIKHGITKTRDIDLYYYLFAFYWVWWQIPSTINQNQSNSNRSTYRSSFQKTDDCLIVHFHTIYFEYDCTQHFRGPCLISVAFRTPSRTRRPWSSSVVSNFRVAVLFFFHERA
jgi:hypothetical protein